MKLIVYFILLSTTLLITGCGQSGNLYLPQNAPQHQPAFAHLFNS